MHLTSTFKFNNTLVSRCRRVGPARNSFYHQWNRLPRMACHYINLDSFGSTKARCCIQSGVRNSDPTSSGLDSSGYTINDAQSIIISTIRRDKLRVQGPMELRSESRCSYRCLTIDRASPIPPWRHVDTWERRGRFKSANPESISLVPPRPVFENWTRIFRWCHQNRDHRRKGCQSREKEDLLQRRLNRNYSPSAKNIAETQATTLDNNNRDHIDTRNM